MAKIILNLPYYKNYETNDINFITHNEEKRDISTHDITDMKTARSSNSRLNKKTYFYPKKLLSF